MFALVLVRDYALWHYTKAFALMTHVFANLLWFIWHFFSIPQLAKNLFAPFKRITEKRRGFSFEDIAGTIIVNLLSRLIGALLRTLIVLLGLTILGLSSLFFLAIYLFWVLLPVLMMTTFVYGLILILTNL